MKLTMLGTGHAMVTKCYNTCFTLSDGEGYLLVDAGGGNGIIAQLERAGIAWENIHEIIVTHKHVDHLLGVVWAARALCSSMRQGRYEGEAYIYAHDEVIGLIDDLCRKLLVGKESRFIGERLHLVTVSDGERREILGRPTTFFDIHSTKARQYGFTMELENGEKLTCCGDEPYNECEREYAQNSKWLLHEAFCLYSQADIYEPYEKHHSTVKDACELAERLGVRNLVLYHTEDDNFPRRKELYLAEGRQYFHGNLFVPDDFEAFEL